MEFGLDLNAYEVNILKCPGNIYSPKFSLLCNSPSIGAKVILLLEEDRTQP